MERNKWEEEFKNKLNQREITPTPHAWERLDAMLNEADSKTEKPVRRLNLLYVAAGVAAFILLATVLYKPEKPGQQNEIVVEETPKKEQPVNSGNVQAENGSPQQQTQVAESAPEHRQQATPKSKGNGNPEPLRVWQEQQQSQVAQAQSEQRPGINSPVFPNVEPSKIDNPKTSVSPMDKKADEQLASLAPKLQKPQTVKVDANALLSQVDGELEMTFREKAIKTVSRQYQNVKVALANRNNKE